jgi:hypothetical protein
VPLLKLYGPGGVLLFCLYRQNYSGSQLWLLHSGAYFPTQGTLPLDTWGHFDVRISAAGARASTIEVRHDGILIYHTAQATVARTGVQAVQIGNNTPQQPFALFVDNIAVEAP